MTFRGQFLPSTLLRSLCVSRGSLLLLLLSGILQAIWPYRFQATFPLVCLPSCCTSAEITDAGNHYTWLFTQALRIELSHQSHRGKKKKAHYLLSHLPPGSFPAFSFCKSSFREDGFYLTWCSVSHLSCCPDSLLLIFWPQYLHHFCGNK